MYKNKTQNNLKFPKIPFKDTISELVDLVLQCFSMHATAAAKSLQSCLTLCNPIDGSPPDSPIPEILQERTLEWVAIAFSNA